MRAKAAGARLLMVHVVHLPAPIHPVFPHLSQRDTEREVALGRELTERLGELARQHTDLDPDAIDVDVDFSDVPYATVVAKAEEHHARLIVVGHKGHTGLRRMLLGSVAERVVRGAHCPVLVTRPHPATGKILVATDLSDAALSAVEYAAREHQRLGYQLIALHNIELPGGILSALGPLGPVPYQPTQETLDDVACAAQQLLHDQLERFGAQGEAHVTAEAGTDEVILRLAERHDVELIVIGSHGRTGIAPISIGSVAHSILQHAHCSVVAVHMR
jgi:nucleotide-binding universal stress UspA family protein